MRNETIQILGAEKCRTRAFVAERKMLAERMSRAAHVVGNSGKGSQVDGRASEWYEAQLREIGVGQRRVQREMIWGRPLMPYMLLWRKPKATGAIQAVLHKLRCRRNAFPHSGERGNLLQPTGDSNAAGDE